MKNLSQILLTCLFVMLSLGGQRLTAQVVTGKVYNFVNHTYNTSSMSVLPDDQLNWRPTQKEDYKQLWLAEATGISGQFKLKNLFNGKYLRGTTQMRDPWKMVTNGEDAHCKFYCIKNEVGYLISTHPQAKGPTCMYCGTGKGRIVSWNADLDKASWHIEEVNIAPEILEQHWKDLAEQQSALQNKNIYDLALRNLFADKACTVLKEPTKDFSTDANFLKLSPVLQQMVLKVQSGDWTENNENNKPKWDSDYAKKFRVQLYEPYCDPNEASAALMINPHTNLNNPTGLYGNRMQVIYVMVEGTIKPGSRLYWGAIVGHGQPAGNPDTGTTLHEGLNVIPVLDNESAFFINYVADTFKGGKTTGRKLSEFPDLKIHIEGGHINGYYNVVGDELYRPDKDADWNYYEQRANLQNITILGKYQTIQFFLNDAPDDKGHLCPGLSKFFTDKVSVEKVMEVWDRIQYSERLTLGLLGKADIEAANKQYPTLDDPSRGIYAYMGNDKELPVDYSDIYRLHGLSLNVQNNFMFASSYFSGYNVNTMNAVIGAIVDDPKAIWGPSHEIGHQHQRAINMTGLTEVSNNLFSNVSMWFKGELTSRMNSHQGVFANISNDYDREGNDFFTNLYNHKGWGLSQMYYKLWLYYHLIGHNNKFYPRLFEMLRHDPMAMGPEPTDGAKTLLHFYKLCCKASGEDLTDFFKAYNMFKPMDNREVGDYGPRHYNLSQAQIDAAVKEVKSWNLPINRCVLFINDATNEVTYGHDGKTRRALFDKSPSSELGGYIHYYQGKEGKSDGHYTALLENHALRISDGKGGVGFAVYDEKMELLAFSDRTIMNLSPKAEAALKEHKATLYAVNGDNTLQRIIVGFPSSLVRLNQGVTKGTFNMEPVKAEMESEDKPVVALTGATFSSQPGLLAVDNQPVAKNLGLFVFNKLVPQMSSPLTATFTLPSLPSPAQFDEVGLKLHFLWGDRYAPERNSTKCYMNVEVSVGKDDAHMISVRRDNFYVTKDGGADLVLHFPRKPTFNQGESLKVQVKITKGNKVSNGYIGLSDIVLKCNDNDKDKIDRFVADWKACWKPINAEEQYFGQYPEGSLEQAQQTAKTYQAFLSNIQKTKVNGVDFCRMQSTYRPLGTLPLELTVNAQGHLVAVARCNVQHSISTTWTMKPVANGNYSLKHANSERYYDLDKGCLSDQEVELVLIDNGDGTFKIRTAAGKYLQLDQSPVVSSQAPTAELQTMLVTDPYAAGTDWYLPISDRQSVEFFGAPNGNGGWCSIYWPFDAMPMNADVVCYGISSIDVEKGQVVLKPMNGVKAGQGALLHYKGQLNENGIQSLSFHSGQYAYAEVPAFENLLGGTLVDLDISASQTSTDYYVLGYKNNDCKLPGLYGPSTQTHQLLANKAFLTLPKSALPAGSGLSFLFDDLSTGIDDVLEGNPAEEVSGEDAGLGNAVYYDLSGRRVNHPSRGIYILKGKKVYVK